MSTATAQRERVSAKGDLGLRAREVAPVAPSKMRPSSMSSLTRRLTAPRRMFMERARSAREMGRVRTRLRAIWRLIWRGVPRVAMRKLFGSIFLMGSSERDMESSRSAQFGHNRDKVTCYHRYSQAQKCLTWVRGGHIVLLKVKQRRRRC